MVEYMRIYIKIVNRIGSFAHTMVRLLMAILLGVVFVNVILRFFGQSLRWADEVARLVFIWLAFLGMFVGYQRGVHPSFLAFIEKMSNKNPMLKKVFLLIIYSSILFFLFIIFYGGLIYVAKSHIQTTAILRLSVGWKYAASPLGAFLMIMESIKKIIFVFTDVNIEKINEENPKKEVGG